MKVMYDEHKQLHGAAASAARAFNLSGSFCTLCGHTTSNHAHPTTTRLQPYSEALTWKKSSSCCLAATALPKGVHGRSMKGQASSPPAHVVYSPLRREMVASG